MSNAMINSANSRSETQPGGFDPSFFDRLSSIERRHFWFRARNNVIAGMARRVAATLPPGFVMLEVGCGTGNSLAVLERSCPAGIVVGVDLWFEGLRYARQRTSCSLVQADLRLHPFTKQFDLIGAFDVIEHLPQDEEAMAGLRAMLAPGGRLLVTVPAHQSLWSYFDEASCHCRRYSSSELRAKLRRAGFEIDFLTQFMAGLFPFIWFGRRLARLSQHGSQSSCTAPDLAARELRVIPVLNQMLYWLCSWEAWWLSRGHSLPIGTSLAAVARKI
jgi:SAM-dependent methyltransferase